MPTKDGAGAWLRGIVQVDGGLMVDEVSISPGRVGMDSYLQEAGPKLRCAEWSMGTVSRCAD